MPYRVAAKYNSGWERIDRGEVYLGFIFQRLQQQRIILNGALPQYQISGDTNTITNKI